MYNYLPVQLLGTPEGQTRKNDKRKTKTENDQGLATPCLTYISCLAPEWIGVQEETNNMLQSF